MSDEKKITVTRTIPAQTQEVFDFLTNPDKHPQADGSGMLRSAEKAQRIQKVGDTFRMNMHAEAMGGDYQMDNTVTGYVENKLLAWQPAQIGQETKGWEWMYELEPEGDSTRVTLTYDWSKVTDKELLAKNIFPAVSEEQMEASLAELANALA